MAFTIRVLQIPKQQVRGILGDRGGAVLNQDSAPAQTPATESGNAPASAPSELNILNPLKSLGNIFKH